MGRDFTIILALRHPVTKIRHGFVARTLVFGPIEDVLRYNVLFRILAALTNRFLGIPLVDYFGDFAVMIREQLAVEACRVFAEFCTLLGFRPKPGKSTVSNSTVSLA